MSKPTDETPDHLPEHPDVTDLSRDETLVFEPSDADPQRGRVHRLSHSGDPPGGFCSVEIHVGRTIWDLEAQYDPRDGWSDLTVYERSYFGNDLERYERGTVETIGDVELGVDPAALSPGMTVTDWSGDDFRIVIEPAEREYDDKALAYNLDGTSNVTEKLDPDDIRVESLPREDDSS